jgi:YfiH family protein
MLTVPILASVDGIRHGFFTRQGGVSTGIYASLNCGPGSRDNAADVKENRARVAKALGAASDRLLTPYQVHSAKAAVTDAPWAPERMPEADAVVTAASGLAIGVLTADCAPVLFCDHKARVIAAAHVGWRGALSGIIDATIEAMEALGTARERIVAAIGPAISQQAYEVGAEYRDRFLAEDPEAAPYFAEDESTGELHFDLPGYVAERLARAKVANIADLRLCTYCDETRLFSYRRSKHHGETDCGRQISAIVLA